jgi:2-oxo-4-hydroxy-4-carboxy--5-ureidoimidazoline (OHCU) decarboxylase
MGAIPQMFAEEIYEALKKERIEAGLDAFEESENEKNQEEQDFYGNLQLILPLIICFLKME